MVRPSDAKSIRKLPAYSAPDAAIYLALAPSTVRYWAFGRSQAGEPEYPPTISVADPDRRLLSFENLVELHVLSSIRGKGVTLPKIRAAVQFLRGQFGSEHPLATEEMFTSGKELLVKKLGVHLEVSSSPGQVAISQVIESHLDRVRRENDIPVRLFPFLDRKHVDAHRPVMIDPRISFGRPCLVDTGIPTAALVERWRAGESMESIAHDFDRPSEQIEEAIKYATARARAA